MIDREATERMEDADAHIRELEAQCAAMRGTLDHLALWAEGKDPELAARLRALYGDAGRAMLERVENLEKLRHAVKNAIGQDGTDDWSDVFDILHALEPKR